MKFIDLNNLEKYFYMADTAYYTPSQFKGSITEVAGYAINTLTEEFSRFYIKLNQDDTITFKVGDIVKLLQ